MGWNFSSAPLFLGIFMKIFKRILYILPIILIFSGCSAAPEGFGTVKKAKELYEKLDSARVVMMDNKTGRQMMSFEFYVNKNGEMVFSYESEADGEFAYSDGMQFYYKTDGRAGWTAVTPKDEEYIYNVYNKTYRYPYARGGIFFLDGTSVASHNIEQTGGGSEITYVYDCDKLNGYAADKLENVSSFSRLECTYTINADGYITEFSQKGAVTDAAGGYSEMDVTLYVMEMNGITDIENPVDSLFSE